MLNILDEIMDANIVSKLRLDSFFRSVAGLPLLGRKDKNVSDGKEKHFQANHKILNSSRPIHGVLHLVDKFGDNMNGHPLR